MKKCYIAGQISGVQISKAYKNFFLAECELEKMGYKPVNPMALPHKHNKESSSYMRECIAALIECDFIYMLVGWGDSEGAKLEYDLAVKLGITVLYQPKESFYAKG
jgi:hypothetical protein